MKLILKLLLGREIIKLIKEYNQKKQSLVNKVLTRGERLQLTYSAIKVVEKISKRVGYDYRGQ